MRWTALGRPCPAPANTAPSTAAALTAMIHGATFSLDGWQTPAA